MFDLLKAIRRWFVPRARNVGTSRVARAAGPSGEAAGSLVARRLRLAVGSCFVAPVFLALLLSGCSENVDPSPAVTVTNHTTMTIRISGNCVADDPHTLAPGVTDNELYLGAQCRIDNGDGLNGVLGCITLKAAHTDITAADLRNPPGPNDCWGAGDRP